MMRFSRKLVIGCAAAAIGFGGTAQAQDALSTECVTANAPDWLAGSLVDDFLATRGIGEGTDRPFRETIQTLADECGSEAGFRPEDEIDYRIFAMTTLMLPEAGTRLLELQVNVGRIDRAIEHHLEDANLDLQQFVGLLEPELEDEARYARDGERAVMLMGVYVAAQYLARNAAAGLAQ